MVARWPRVTREVLPYASFLPLRQAAVLLISWKLRITDQVTLLGNLSGFTGRFVFFWPRALARRSPFAVRMAGIGPVQKGVW